MTTTIRRLASLAAAVKAELVAQWTDPEIRDEMILFLKQSIEPTRVTRLEMDADDEEEALVIELETTVLMWHENTEDLAYTLMFEVAELWHPTETNQAWRPGLLLVIDGDPSRCEADTLAAFSGNRAGHETWLDECSQ